MQSTYKCIAIVSLLTVVAGVATAAETSAPPDSQLIAALKAKVAEEAAADSFSGRCCQPKTETRALLGRMVWLIANVRRLIRWRFFADREWIRHRSNGIRISRIQELARDS